MAWRCGAPTRSAGSRASSSSTPLPAARGHDGSCVLHRPCPQCMPEMPTGTTSGPWSHLRQKCHPAFKYTCITRVFFTLNKTELRDQVRHPRGRTRDVGSGSGTRAGAAAAAGIIEAGGGATLRHWTEPPCALAQCPVQLKAHQGCLASLGAMHPPRPPPPAAHLSLVMWSLLSKCADAPRSF